MNLIVLVKHEEGRVNQLVAGTQPAFTWSKLTIETLAQGVKYVES